MNVLVAIDDTDNLETKGTGHLAERIARDIEERGWGRRSYITRHQLLVHPDVPYTSHNSAMCFTAALEPGARDAFVADAIGHLEQGSAPGSDPGLCVADADAIADRAALLDFGARAKRDVLRQAEAYALAGRLGLHLSAHGGTGGGVIGALAAVGLRLGGSDGRVRGGLDIPSVNGVATVGDILAHRHVEGVRTVAGAPLRDHEAVRLVGEKVKAVLLEGKRILLVTETAGDHDDVRWQNCPKELLRAY